MITMKRGAIFAALLVLLTQTAHATVFITISDVSRLSFQTWPDGRVLLRNLDTFDSHALPCCWNYWVDTTTQEGKNIYALILFLSTTGGSMSLGLPDGYASGTVDYATRN